MRAFVALALPLALLISACPPAPTAPVGPPPAPPPSPAPVPPVPPAPKITIASSAEPPASTTVAIVGGGLAGLVTAHELKKQGVAFHILEMQDILGGRVQTAYYENGLNAEYGMQEVWADNPLVGVMKDLKIELDGEPEAPFSSMVLDGKVYPFTQETNDAYFASMMKPDEIAQLKKWMESAKRLRALALKDGLKNAEIQKIHGQTFKQWIDSFKMSKRVNDWIRLTIECELATTWDIFSAVVGLIEFGVFLGEGEPNYHVKGGNSKLIEALVAGAMPHVTTGATVQRVDRPGAAGKNAKAIVTFMRHGKAQQLEADKVVVAVPPWRLHQIHFEPTLGAKKWEAVSSTMRGSYTVVHMIVDKAFHKITDVGGASPFPVLSDGVLGVIYGVQNEAPPESKHEVFAFLVHGGAGYAFHMQPREAKIAEMKAAMDKLWPGWSKNVVNTYVYTYHPGAIAVWPMGRSPIDDKAIALRTPEDRVILAGDYTWSGHSDGAAKSAIDAAKWAAGK